MNQTIKIALSLMVGLTAALALACGAPDEMSKANQLVGEANAADAEASKTN